MMADWSKNFNLFLIAIPTPSGYNLPTMAERGFTPRDIRPAPTGEADIEQKVEREPAKESLRRPPCPGESVPDWETARMVFGPNQQGVVLGAKITPMGEGLPLATRCPLLPATSDLDERKLEPGQVVVHANCIACWHGVLAATVQDKGLPPASLPAPEE